MSRIRFRQAAIRFADDAEAGDAEQQEERNGPDDIEAQPTSLHDAKIHFEHCDELEQFPETRMLSSECRADSQARVAVLPALISSYCVGT